MLPKINLNNIIEKGGIGKKVLIHFSSATAGDDYDGYEQRKTFTNLNPISIKAYVNNISPEALIYKQYGLHNLGAVQILCSSRYENYFRICNKITIDGNEYQVFKEGTGQKALISPRPYDQIRIILTRNG